jgi:hypothetical protein
VPAALEWPPYDREALQQTAPAMLATGTVIYSIPREAQIDPMGIEIWSRGAIAQRDAFWLRVLRDRCAARETLQVANGVTPTPDGVCQKSEVREQRSEVRSQRSAPISDR